MYNRIFIKDEIEIRMGDFLIKARLFSEIVLCVVSLYTAFEVTFTTTLPNFICLGIGVFALICAGGTIDKIQNWGRYKDEKGDE